VELKRCIHVLGQNGYLDGTLRGEVITV
jgi:hypothetical protein